MPRPRALDLTCLGKNYKSQDMAGVITEE